MAKVIIFGTSQISDMAHFYLTHDSTHEVVGFTVDQEFRNTDRHLDLPVVPFHQVEMLYPPSAFSMFVAMSYRSVNRLRAEKYAEAKAKGYSLISYISSKALTYSTLIIGDNCLILEGSIVQPFVNIGNDVTVWSGAHIGHHSIIQDHCFLAPKVAVSGNVTIEPYCFLGINATVRDGLKMARASVAGAGAVILKDTEAGEVCVGNPARPLPVRSNELQDL